MARLSIQVFVLALIAMKINTCDALPHASASASVSRGAASDIVFVMDGSTFITGLEEKLKTVIGDLAIDESQARCAFLAFLDKIRIRVSLSTPKTVNEILTEVKVHEMQEPFRLNRTHSIYQALLGANEELEKYSGPQSNKYVVIATSGRDDDKSKTEKMVKQMKKAGITVKLLLVTKASSPATPAKMSTPEPTPNAASDVVFVIDASTFIPGLETGVKSLAKQLSIDLSKVRCGYITFITRIRTRVSLKTPYTMNEVFGRIRFHEEHYSHELDSIHSVYKGLLAAEEELKKYSGPQSNKFVVIVTSGRDDDKSKTEKLVKQMKRNGVKFSQLTLSVTCEVNRRDILLNL